MTKTEELIERLKSYAMCCDTMREASIYFETIEALRQPEVVRCWECVLRNTINCPMYSSPFLFTTSDKLDDMDYCSYGERRAE